MVKVMLQHPEATQLDTCLAQYLVHLETLTAAYERGHKSVPAAGMQDEFLAWNGFFDKLAAKLKVEDLHWNYVSNPKGGFLGMWWCFKPITELKLEADAHVYFQLEQAELSIRAGRWGDGTRSISSADRYHLLAECRRLLESSFEELGYSLHDNGRPGRTCRLFYVLPKRANKKAKTFKPIQPIEEVADALKAITKAFELGLG